MPSFAPEWTLLLAFGSFIILLGVLWAYDKYCTHREAQRRAETPVLPVYSSNHPSNVSVVPIAPVAPVGQSVAIPQPAYCGTRLTQADRDFRHHQRQSMIFDTSVLLDPDSNNNSDENPAHASMSTYNPHVAVSPVDNLGILVEDDGFGEATVRPITDDDLAGFRPSMNSDAPLDVQQRFHLEARGHTVVPRDLQQMLPMIYIQEASAPSTETLPWYGQHAPPDYTRLCVPKQPKKSKRRTASRSVLPQSCG
ncbi:hypothetical protein P154DRAFT_524527 [Amniculicola lignicola CBS 123094]|uniref:Uncharacterized protein n=1 Tax=Amniculicola lignicola CBS 123094 TaxID=1392246 RepID=A0A6A5WA76_9PLEO|nr:hypothetical protein P154DRAFT_524527 [Amniculicola lignicola CBS 123094]